MITHVHKKRLLFLADFLDKLPPDRFDYETWVGPDWQGHQDLSCGTRACALGWAATLPRFRRLGLRLAMWDDGSLKGIVKLKNDNDPTAYGSPAAAAQAIFGDESKNLFFPTEEERDYTPREVAQKIRRFVERHSE